MNPLIIAEIQISAFPMDENRPYAIGHLMLLFWKEMRKMEYPMRPVIRFVEVGV